MGRGQGDQVTKRYRLRPGAIHSSSAESGENYRAFCRTDCLTNTRPRWTRKLSRKSVPSATSFAGITPIERRVRKRTPKYDSVMLTPTSRRYFGSKVRCRSCDRSEE